MFDYAKKIREYRERKFLTQYEYAKRLNVSYFLYIDGRQEGSSQTRKTIRS